MHVKPLCASLRLCASALKKSNPSIDGTILKLCIRIKLVSACKTQNIKDYLTFFREPPVVQSVGALHHQRLVAVGGKHAPEIIDRRSDQLPGEKSPVSKIDRDFISLSPPDFYLLFQDTRRRPTSSAARDMRQRT